MYYNIMYILLLYYYFIVYKSFHDMILLSRIIKVTTNRNIIEHDSKYSFKIQFQAPLKQIIVITQV